MPDPHLEFNPPEAAATENGLRCQTKSPEPAGLVPQQAAAASEIQDESEGLQIDNAAVSRMQRKPPPFRNVDEAVDGLLGDRLAACDDGEIVDVDSAEGAAAEERRGRLLVTEQADSRGRVGSHIRDGLVAEKE